MSTPPFEVVPHAEAMKIRPVTRSRRDWAPVLRALLNGATVFMTNEFLSDSDVKYLSLALARRKSNERLRTSRINRGGDEGRVLEVYRHD